MFINRDNLGMCNIKKIITINIFILCLCFQADAAVMQGGVSENAFNNTNVVLDKSTNLPIAGAKINIPHSNYSTYTDDKGRFSVPLNTPKNSILSVQKQNYKPFSITITDKNIGKPMTLSVEKSNKFDIVIDTEIHHIGDNNYSMASANAAEFKCRSVGNSYIKTFFMPAISKTKQNYLVIGSIIGIDTALARGMGQNNITSAFASPPSIYFNGQKIAEIKINGDNQRIKIPTYLIRPNQSNQVKISAGINLLQTAYLDYDDIEFMNLNIE